MGCGASKDAGAVQTATSREIPSSSAPEKIAASGTAASTNVARSAVSTPVTSASGSSEINQTSSATTSKPSTNGVGTGTIAPTMMVNLNDAVLPSSPESDSPGGHQGRERFLSYASGASTPNTSSGNLSWDGKSDKSSSSRDNADGSGFSQPGSTLSRSGSDNKKKLLKHSGSAIGLDEIHTEGAGLSSKVVHIEVPFGKPIEEVYDGVHNGPVLGSGVSGLVRLVKHKATGLEYAVKCLDLGLVGTKEGLAQLREEIFIMCQLDHPNIVRLEEVYESHNEIYLVQELCLGGELFDRLDEQPDYHYTEAECARLVKQMLSAVRYLHSKGIIHRDLKLENFLFSSKATDSELKMIDFGLSKHFRFGEVHHEAVGTPYTVAPEVIRGTYDERCDIWAIGVITFLLLSGDPPFGGCGGPEPLMTVRSNILSGKFEYEPEDIWCLVSGKAKEFVNALLVTDPQSRPTAREAQKHPWLREWASRQSTKNDTVLNPNVVKALVNFKEFSDMRKLLSEVLSFTLLPDQIKELRKEFEKMDTDGSGEISLAALKQVLMTNAGAGSLGALKEEEVEDIFNAMRVNKSETRIHWHEFIAAGLSQCQVDDRNLRLAFDRLDSDHKGYITLDDIMNLLGTDTLQTEEHIQSMWKNSLFSGHCTQTHITYENFLLLMKGQPKEKEPSKAVVGGGTAGPAVPPELVSTPSSRVATGLLSVPEGDHDDEAEMDVKLSSDMKNNGSATASPIASKTTTTTTTNLATGGSTQLGGEPKVPQSLLEKKNDDDVSLHSLPNIGATTGMYESSNSELGMGSPIIPDSPADRKTTTISVAEVGGIPDMPSGSTPTTMPLAPTVSSSSVSSPDPSTMSLTRKRSQSLVDDNVGVGTETSATPTAAPYTDESRRSSMTDLDKNKSALSVNRTLYRAHRQMRLAVMDASRRFEEQQARRARDTLMAQQEREAGDGTAGGGMAPHMAGLVMRHGHKVQVTSEAIRKYLEESRIEHQQLVEKNNRRGGRGRSIRKKTISDMSAMMNPSMGQDELGEISMQAAAASTKTPDISSRRLLNASLSSFEVPDLPPKRHDSTGNNSNGGGGGSSSTGRPTSKRHSSTSSMGSGSAGAASTSTGKSKKRGTSPKPTTVATRATSDTTGGVVPPNIPLSVVDNKQLRKATVPGDFRKVQDPFSAEGMYGGARISAVDVNQISKGVSTTTNSGNGNGATSTSTAREPKS